MSWLVPILIITASVSAAPTDKASDNRLESLTKESTIDNQESMIDLLKPRRRIPNDDDVETSSENDAKNDQDFIAQETISDQSTRNSEITSDATESDVIKLKDAVESKEGKKALKKSRKHKALFIDYNPFVPQLSAIPNFDAYDDLGSEERTPGGGGRKRYPESNIYYIRLPPTPYMFVPGLGYVSQPPSYSTGPMRPQIAHVRPQVNPYRPHSVYNSPINDINPFINLPLDFVSNGKPTSVYQWQSPSYQPIKRPDTQISTLDKGPYFFNGRPHGIYLLRQDPRPQIHQSLQFPDYQDTSYY